MKLFLCFLFMLMFVVPVQAGVGNTPPAKRKSVGGATSTATVAGATTVRPIGGAVSRRKPVAGSFHKR